MPTSEWRHETTGGITTIYGPGRVVVLDEAESQEFAGELAEVGPGGDCMYSSESDLCAVYVDVVDFNRGGGRFA